MTPRSQTWLVIASTVVLWIGWDFYVGLRYGSDATISKCIAEVSRDYAIVPFGVGLLCGHFFTQMASEAVNRMFSH